MPGERGKRQRFGNMVLSRLPVGRILRHALPWEADGSCRNMPRLLLEVEIAAAFGPVRIMTTHLEYFSPRLRAAQVAAIRQIYSLAIQRSQQPPHTGKGPYAGNEAPDATILTGDFNMRPDDPVKLSLSHSPAADVDGLVDAWIARHPGTPHPPSFCITDQKYGPPHCCDFVFVSQELVQHLRRVEYDIVTRASDHQPVLLELFPDGC
jgi:endonuclease/exonuclease/phosphatase family metal-dependent hydrolase